MIVPTGNYSLSNESVIECAPYTEWNSNYKTQLAMGRSSIPKSLSIRRNSIQKEYSLLIRKYHEGLKYSLQINNKIKFGWKERHNTFKERLTIGASESSLFKDFDKWKSEEKQKRLSIAPSESIKIARIFVTEEVSLEVLLMLADEGPQSIEEICNAIPPKEKTIRVLFDLWEYDVISVNGDKVNITPRGHELVSKLRKKSQER